MSELISVLDNSEFVKLVNVLKKKYSIQIMKTLRCNPELRYTEIREKSKVKEGSVAHYLNMLIDAGLVEKKLVISSSLDGLKRYDLTDVGYSVFDDFIYPSYMMLKENSKVRQL